MDYLLFEELIKDAQKKGYNTTNSIGEYIETNLRISKRTINRMFQEYEQLEDKKDFSFKRADQRKIIAQSLGYKNYEAFYKENAEKKEKTENQKSITLHQITNHITNDNSKKAINIDNSTTSVDNRTTNSTTNITNNYSSLQAKKLIISLLFFIAIITTISFIYLNRTPNHCMIWKNNLYQLIDCEKAEKLGLNSIPFNEKVQALKQIKPNEIKDVKNTPLWRTSYKGKQEFFNQNGSHPISKEKLIPVTQAFINNYLKLLEENKTTKKSVIKTETPNLTKSANNATATHCFVNERDEIIFVQLNLNNVIRNITISALEKACLNDLNEGKYEITVFSSSKNIISKENKEINKSTLRTTRIRYKKEPEKSVSAEIILSPNNETKKLVKGVQSIKDCEKNNTGDLTITNSSNAILSIQIAKKVSNSLLFGSITNITIAPNSSETTYSLESGNYSLTITKEDKYLDQINKSAFIKSCKTSNVHVN